MTRYSEILQTNITKTSTGYDCADGVKYTFDELTNIKECATETKRYLHKLKKMFKGEII